MSVDRRDLFAAVGGLAAAAVIGILLGLGQLDYDGAFLAIVGAGMLVAVLAWHTPRRGTRGAPERKGGSRGPGSRARRA